MKAHPTFQRNAKEKLDSGRYKLADDGFTELSKDEQRANMSKLTARSLGLNDDEVDVTQGMGFKGRLSLSFQPTEQDKFQELEKRYGRENIQAIDIGGKTKLLYRDAQETNNQFRAVDEEGTSIADFFADTAGAAVPIAGAIGAAIATGGTSIPLTALAAAGGGFAASAGQDIAVRAASDEDIRLGEIGRRRGIETAIGIPIDLVTGVGGRIIAKSVGKRTVEKAAGDLTKQVDDLLTKFDPDANIQLTPAQATNVDASLAQSVRAGIDQGGAEARALAAQRDQIGKLSRILRGEDVVEEPIEDVMKSITERQFRLIDAYEKRVALMDAKRIEADALAKKQTKVQRQAIEKRVLAERNAELKAMREQAEEGVQKLVKGRQRLESAMGGDIRNQQQAGYNATKSNSESLYDDFYNKVDTQQAYTPIADVYDVLKGIDETRLIPDSSEMRGLQSLKKRVSEAFEENPDLRKPDFLTFRELDGYIRDVTDGIRYNKTHNFKQSEKSLQDIGRRLDKLRDNAMSAPKKLGGLGAGEPAKRAYKKAQKHYKEKMLPFFDGDRKANLSMVAGGSDVAPGARGANVMARTFATNESVKDALNSGVSRNTLKEAYLERQVAAAGDGEIALSPDIMAALYPKGGGKAIVAKVKAINDAIRRGKNKASVTAKELDELMSDFTPGAASKAKRYIESKAASQAKAKAARQNALIKISKGEMPAPDDIHHLVNDIAKMRPGQIAKLMERLPSDRARASLGRSAFDSLMEKAGKASAKAQRTGKATDSQALWEPDTMSRILNNSAERKQWEALIGKDVVADLDKLNNWLLSSSAITRDMAEGIGRFVTSTGASGTPNVLFVSPQLPRWIGRKILGIVHTSPLTRAMMMRKLKTAELDEQAVMNLFYVAMGTQRGMSAISDEMAKDPTFSAWVQESSKGDPGMSPEAP
jgi:hypothetical protein